MRKIKIGDAGVVITGKTPKTNLSQYYNGDFPFVTPADFNELKTIKMTSRTISESGLDSIKNCFIPKRSICVTCIGSDMGKIGITEMDCATNQQINTLVPFEHNDPDFIYYAIKQVTPLIKRMGETATAVPIVNKTDFSNVKIYCPQDHKEQEAIAKKLIFYDAKIENNIVYISILEDIITGIYKHWFIDFNYPNSTGELENDIPKGWEISNVYDRVTEVKQKNKNNDSYPVLSVVKEGEFKLSDDVFTKQVYSKNTTNYKIVRKNQVGYNPARANIGSISMLKDFEVGLVSPIYIVFEMNKTITPTYFYYYMKQPIFAEMIKHHAIGTTRQNFPFGAFKMFPLVVPPMELQLKFEELARPIEQKIAKLKEENDVLAEIRDTLLPKLLSGELTVEVGE